MAKDTAWGNQAYRQAIIDGKSKEIANTEKKAENERYWSHVKIQQFQKSGNYNKSLENFSNSKNSGRWHTSEDL
jgi:nitroimidazol reductase NimA-like FMN-containing flavoprotein (pyridoxamine 5'-phosphate oxidase superfamily)